MTASSVARVSLLGTPLLMIEQQRLQTQVSEVTTLRQEVFKLTQNNEVLLNCLEAREATIDKLQREVIKLSRHLNPTEVEL